MQKPRRHERMFLFADVEVRPNQKRTQRYPARVFNVSKAGVGVFSKQHFAPGEIVGMELHLPLRGRETRAFVLYGTVRHTRVETDGNTLGIEFVLGQDAGDYEQFARYMDRHAGCLATPRDGFTLVEACIAMTVVCLLATMALPFYTRAVEQSRLDVASAKLRTVWSAERIYWLERRTFTASMGDLHAMDLVDPSLPASQSSADAVYVYQLVRADEATFLARAIRNGSGTWIGSVEIDETSAVSGSVRGRDGQQLTPSP